jgi:hypothetical protein
LSAFESLSASDAYVQKRFNQISAPRLTEIRMNAEAQVQQMQAFEVAQRNGDFVRAAMIASELGSPLLQSKSPETQKWLRTHQDQNINTNSPPHFSAPELEHDRGATLKILDFAISSRPQLRRDRGQAWVRAALSLIQAAGVAQAHGNSQEASLLLSRANTIARFLAGAGSGAGVTIGQNQTFSESTTPMSQSFGNIDSEAVNRAARNTILGEMGINPANDIAGYSALVTQLQKTSGADAQPYLQLAASALSRQPPMNDMMKAIVEVSVDTAIGMNEKTSLRGIEKALLEGDREPSLRDFAILANLPSIAREMFFLNAKRYADVYLNTLPPKERQERIEQGRKVAEGLLKTVPLLDEAVKVWSAVTHEDLAGRRLSDFEWTSAVIDVVTFAHSADLPQMEDRYLKLLDAKGRDSVHQKVDFASGVSVPDSSIEQIEQGLARANLRAQNLGLNATPIYGGSGAAAYRDLLSRYDIANGKGSFETRYGDNFNTFTILLNKAPDKVTFVRFEDGNGNAVGPIVPRAAVEGHTMKELELAYPSLHADAVRIVTPVDLRANDVITIVNPKGDSFDKKGSFSEFGTSIEIPNPEPRMFDRPFDFKPDQNGRVQFQNLEAKP